MNVLRFVDKIIEYSFYAVFFFVPLVFTNSNSELFELTKMWVTWGLTIVIATAWISKMIIEKKVTIQRTPLDIPIALFFVSQVVSTIFSIDHRVSLWGYYSRFNGGLLSIASYIFLYYAFVTFVSSEKRGDSETKLHLLWFVCGAITVVGGFFLTIATKLPFFLMLSLVVSFFLFVRAFTANTLWRVLYISVLTGLLVGIWGIPAHFGNDPTCLLFRQTFDVSCWTEAFRPTIRTFSTLGQPAWLAAYMAVLLPIVIAFSVLLFEKVQRTRATIMSLAAYLAAAVLLFYFSRWQLAFFVSIVPVAIFFLPKISKSMPPLTLASLFFLPLVTTYFYLSLIFSSTRAGFIAFWVTIAFFWVALFTLTILPRKRLLPYAFAMTITFALLNFFFGSPIGQLQQYTLPNIISHVHTTAHAQTEQTPQSPETPTQDAQPVNLGITDSGDIRLHVWKGALDIWKANPLFGSGVETYAWAYYKHRPAGHNLTSEWDFLYNKAHNEYLNYLATTGAFGLGTYVLMSLWFFAVIGRRLSLMNNQERLRSLTPEVLFVIALVASYGSIIITNFLGFSVVIINVYLFLIPAFVFALLSMLPAKAADPQMKHHAHVSVSGGQWAGISLLTIFSCYLLFLLFTFWRADKAYGLGYNLDRIGDYQAAYPSLQQAVMMRPAEPVYKDEYAFNNIGLALGLYQSNQATMASQLAQQAMTLNDEIVTAYPNNLLFWKNRVRIYYTLSQLDPKYLPVAVQAIQKAHELAPTDAKVSYNLGILLGQVGRKEEAIRSLEETIQLKPDYQDAYYALALYYHELATNGGPTVVNRALQEKAEETLATLLKLNPSHKQAKEELDKWQGL